ncbi:MAG: dockerin type I domain-containing protein [Planctomycetota bacterium]
MVCAGAAHAQVGALLWEENFNDLDNWIAETGNGAWGWGNGELQYYSEDNVDIAAVPGEAGNNALRITAKQESGPGIVDQWGNPLNYTSGRVKTQSNVALQYGMVETRVRVPDLEVGGWPAVWMLGTSNWEWPRKGEIDIMEMGARQEFRDLHDTHNGGNGLNNSTVNEVVGANAIFYSDAAVTPQNPSGAASLSYDPDDDFNRPYYNHTNPLNDRFLTYRLYWDDASMRMTVIDDGVEHDLFADVIPIAPDMEEFHEPHYLIANLAIGGGFTDAFNLGDPGSGQPVSMPFEAEMYVDYIRAYEWNGQGEVHLGPPTPEGGTYGVFTDNTPVDNQMVPQVNGEIFVWEDTLTDAAIAPLEGDNALAWQTTGKGWFGAGAFHHQPLNLSEFGDGFLNFSIDIPENVAFQIGIIDQWGNQNYVDFPAFQTTYGLERNGEWGQASIPISDIRGTAIDLRMLSYSFVILEVNGVATQFAIDDIFWSGGLLPNLDGDANGDGVVDLLDFDVLAQNFGQPTAGGASAGDFNGDGVVDLLDFDLLSQNFGNSSPGNVPEPASLALLLLGGAALVRRRR